MIIRLATEADLPAMRAVYAPYVYENVVSFEYAVPKPEAFAARFERITAEFPWLAAEENGEILGYAYASRAFSRAAYDWCADMSVYVSRGARRRGVGAALYAALEARLAEMGLCNLFALITESNTGSIAFHHRQGYEQVGLLPRAGYKFGRWHGVVWMMKRLRETEDPGPAPVSRVDPKDC